MSDEANRAAAALRAIDIDKLSGLGALHHETLNARDAIAAALVALDAQAAETPPWDDAPLPEDEAIEAAHPMRTGHHDLYAEALRLVGARQSKGSLVDLVCWLLTQRRASTERADAAERLCVRLYDSYGALYSDMPAHWHEEVAAMRANQERKT